MDKRSVNILRAFPGKWGIIKE
jgi:hexokinase